MTRRTKTLPSKSERIRQAIENLKRLADDQAGKPEGETARLKIQLLEAKYPDLKPAFRKIDKLTVADYSRMKRAGIDVSGSWTGENLLDALLKMQADYIERLAKFYSQDQDKSTEILLLGGGTL